MTNVIVGFLAKKKADSVFLSLEDGDSVVIKKLKDIKLVTKAGYDGKEKEVLRLKCEVETSEGVREKDFDNGTARFAQEMQEKGIKIGCGFTLSRAGLQTKTRYTISDVIDAKTVSTAPEGNTAPPQ